MMFAKQRMWAVAAAAIFGFTGSNAGGASYAGQMTPASNSQISQQPGQQPGQQPQSPLSQLPSLTDDTKSGKSGDDPMTSLHARQVKLREDERQKRLVSDTEKLLILATQLHDEVAKTDKNILSLEVIKRADEIEKLAHNVKLGMKE